MKPSPNIDGSIPTKISKKLTKVTLNLSTVKERVLANSIIKSLSHRYLDYENYKDKYSVKQIDLILGRLESLVGDKLKQYSKTELENIKDVLSPILEESKSEISDITKNYFDTIFVELLNLSIDNLKNDLVYLFNTNSDNVVSEKSGTLQNNKIKKDDNRTVDQDDSTENEDDKESNDNTNDIVREDEGKEDEKEEYSINFSKMLEVSGYSEIKDTISNDIKNLNKKVKKLILATNPAKKSKKQEKQDRKAFEQLFEEIKIVKEFVDNIELNISKFFTLLDKALNALEKKIIRFMKPLLRFTKLIANKLIFFYYFVPPFIGAIVLAVSLVIAGISYLINRFGDYMLPLFRGFIIGFAYFLKFLAYVIPTLITIFEKIVIGVGWLLETVLNIFMTVIKKSFELFKYLFSKVKKFLVWIVETLIGLFNKHKDLIGRIVTYLANKFIELLDNILMPALKFVLPLLLKLLKFIKPYIKMFIKWILPLQLAYWFVIGKVVTIFGKFIADGMIGLIKMIEVAYTWMKEFVLMPIFGFVNNLGDFGQIIVDKFMESAPKWLIKGISAICDSVGATFSAIGNGAKSVMNFFKKDPPKDLDIKEYEIERKKLVAQWNSLLPLAKIMDEIKATKEIERNSFAKILETVNEIYNLISSKSDEIAKLIFSLPPQLLNNFSIDNSPIESRKKLNIIQVKLKELYNLEADIEQFEDPVSLAEKKAIKKSKAIEDKIDFDEVKKYCTTFFKKIDKKIESRVVYYPI